MLYYFVLLIIICSISLIALIVRAIKLYKKAKKDYQHDKNQLDKLHALAPAGWLPMLVNARKRSVSLHRMHAFAYSIYLIILLCLLVSFTKYL